MLQEIYMLPIAALYGIIAARLIYPFLIKLSVRLKFTDNPGHRKVHKAPVPVVGGIGIVLTLITAAVALPTVGDTLRSNLAVTASLFTLAITGMIDDKVNLSAKLRLLIQLSCAFSVAHSGIRVSSLHGFMGVGHIPEILQYVVTIVLITGITNAINLVDGIDGLAGSLALINFVVLTLTSILLNEFDIAMLLAVVTGALIAFLKFNWRPAKIFMGDGGSLFLGFLMSVVGIFLTEVPSINYNVQSAVPIVLLACFAIPVIDAVRVFAGRMQKGRSPFSADKTHLHHKLIQHFMLHNSATRKIVTLHLIIICSSVLVQGWLSISAIAVMILALIFSYSLFLDFTQSFSVWYRKIKHYEDSY